VAPTAPASGVLQPSERERQLESRVRALESTMLMHSAQIASLVEANNKLTGVVAGVGLGDSSAHTSSNQVRHAATLSQLHYQHLLIRP
jgi:hypothetical protein